jgi:hypothetical protein
VSKQRFARILVGAMVVAAPVAAPASAVASSAKIGTHSPESRCYAGNYGACLYWTTSSSAYWATNTDSSNLAGKIFRSGTGAGAGKAVKNNAEYLSCGFPVACNSYYSTGFSGNNDYALRYTAGALYYTRDHEGSLSLG